VSDTDSFIREVSEEVRQDRMFRLWKKYGALVIGAIAVIVGGTAVWSWLEQQELQARAERGEAFLAVAAGDVAAHQALIAQQEGAAAALAGLRMAEAQAASGDTDAAIATYEQVAAEGQAGAAYTDLARLEAIRLRSASAAPDEMIAELAPLVAEGAPYRLLALELRAALALNAGDVAAARADLDAIVSDPAATGETRSRVQAVIQTLGPAASAS